MSGPPGPPGTPGSPATSPPGASPVGPTRADRPLPVGVLASMIDGALRAGLPATVRVVGEISNFNERTHWYFRLKDADAAVDCVMFAASARRVRPRPADGQKVILTGRVEFYPRHGRTQLYVTAIEPLGEGDLERRFRALCARLRERGWFSTERKRPLPSFPRRVAIVTSATGAALQDVLVTMQRRCPAVEAALVDVRVQGEGAAPEIVAAIDWLSREHERLGIDAILLTRGGGSIEDLWAFNEETVAEAIVRSAVPVVAAIGHETDVTVAELVADERCATPTQAAVRLTPDRAALTEEVDQRSAMLRAQVGRLLDRAHAVLDASSRRLDHTRARRAASEQVRVERLALRLARLRPEALHAARRSAVHELESRLHRAAAARLRVVDLPALAAALHEAGAGAIHRRRDRLAALHRELVLAGPASVLARGYSVTTTADGSVVRSARALRPGDSIRTRVADGAFDATVSGPGARAVPLAPAEPVPARNPPRPAPRRRPAADDRSQMDLF